MKQNETNSQRDELTDDQLEHVTGAMPADDGGEADATFTERKSGGDPN